MQVVGAGNARRLAGPLGRVVCGVSQPIVLLCPIQWSAAHPPGLALLDGEREGLRFAALLSPVNAVPTTRVASLDNVLFRARDLVDVDGARIAMVSDVQVLHSIVRSWVSAGRP